MLFAFWDGRRQKADEHRNMVARGAVCTSMPLLFWHHSILGLCPNWRHMLRPWLAVTQHTCTYYRSASTSHAAMHQGMLARSADHRTQQLRRDVQLPRRQWNAGLPLFLMIANSSPPAHQHGGLIAHLRVRVTGGQVLQHLPDPGVFRGKATQFADGAEARRQIIIRRRRLDQRLD
jgi:hypothetical protein